MLLFCSCDIFSPKNTTDNSLLAIKAKLNNIENQLTFINSSLIIIDSTLSKDKSIIDKSLSNINNLLFLNLDNKTNSTDYNLYEENNDIDAEKVFYETFQIKNIRFKTCVLEEKTTKNLGSYFLNDTIKILDGKLEFEYIVDKINNFEKHIEIYNLNTEKFFKIILKEE